MSSQEPLPYNQVMIVAWTILCVVVATVMFFAFVFNGHILNTGHWIWDLIRHFAQPII